MTSKPLFWVVLILAVLAVFALIIFMQGTVTYGY